MVTAGDGGATWRTGAAVDVVVFGGGVQALTPMMSARNSLAMPLSGGNCRAGDF